MTPNTRLAVTTAEGGRRRAHQAVTWPSALEATSATCGSMPAPARARGWRPAARWRCARPRGRGCGGWVCGAQLGSVGVSTLGATLPLGMSLFVTLFWDLPGDVLAAPESALGLDRCNPSLSLSLSLPWCLWGCVGARPAGTDAIYISPLSLWCAARPRVAFFETDAERFRTVYTPKHDGGLAASPIQTLC